MTDPTVQTAYQALSAKVTALAVELPGISFGYIGNCGFDRGGAYDDRSWQVFLPHPGRVGTFADGVHLGRTAALPAALNRWAEVEARVRRGHGRQTERDAFARPQQQDAPRRGDRRY